MHPKLLAQLIERGVIRPRSEVDATYLGRDLGGNSLVRQTGTFLVMEVLSTSDGYVLDCANTLDGRRRRLPGEAVLKIDGMTPERMGANFALSEDGEPMKVGKRRGRKPKNRTIVEPA